MCLCLLLRLGARGGDGRRRGGGGRGGGERRAVAGDGGGAAARGPDGEAGVARAVDAVPGDRGPSRVGAVSGRRAGQRVVRHRLRRPHHQGIRVPVLSSPLFCLVLFSSLLVSLFPQSALLSSPCIPVLVC